MTRLEEAVVEAALLAACLGFAFGWDVDEYFTFRVRSIRHEKSEFGGSVSARKVVIVDAVVDVDIALLRRFFVAVSCFRSSSINSNSRSLNVATIFCHFRFKLNYIIILSIKFLIILCDSMIIIREREREKKTTWLDNIIIII